MTSILIEVVTINPPFERDGAIARRPSTLRSTSEIGYFRFAYPEVPDHEV